MLTLKALLISTDPLAPVKIALMAERSFNQGARGLDLAAVLFPSSNAETHAG